MAELPLPKCGRDVTSFFSQRVWLAARARYRVGYVADAWAGMWGLAESG